MARTDELAIVRIGPEALAEAVGLTVEANWNQTGDDWAFFLAHGTVFGARDAFGKLVATTAILPYSAGFAWISLVIVAKSHRGRGIGTQLLRECMAALRERALVGMLDATPAGARVYAPLGFNPIMGLKRWSGVGGRTATQGEGVRSLAMSGLQRIAGLDAAAFGANRQTVLEDFYARVGARGFQIEGRSGFALVRPGRVASQLGPVIAAHEHDALALLDAAIASTPASILIDVPDAWTEIPARLDVRGFRVQRTFLRMALGRDMPYGDPPRVFAIAGPEYG